MKTDKIDLLERYKHTELKYFDPSGLIIRTNDPYRKYSFKGPDFEALRESITNNGVLEAILINKDNEVIAGNNRATVCLELGRLVPGIQFLDELSIEDERILVHHTNTVKRFLSASDKTKLIMEHYKDIIGAPKSLPMISRATGIHLSTVKDISAKAKKKREFERLGKSLTESDYKANLKTFIKLRETEAEIAKAQKKKRELIKKLEETAPMPVWGKWILDWEKQKSNKK